MNSADILQIGRGSEQIGNIERADLGQHLAAGTVFPTDVFWSDADSQWHPVGELLVPTHNLDLAVVSAQAERVQLTRELSPIVTREPDPNEELWRGHPYKTLVGKVIWSVLFACTLLGLLYVPFIWIHTVTYRITRRRLIVEGGVLRKTSNEVRIADLRNIKLVNKSLLFGTGTLIFDVAGSNGAEVVFNRVRFPEKIRDLIRELQP